MSSAPIQRIDCEVTFLRDTERGPLAWPKTLSGGRYRPHLVVGDPNQRRAVLTSRMMPVTYSDGSKGEIRTDRYIDEELLGVQFDEGPPQPEVETPLLVTLSLMFWPHPGYDKLQPGSTFTVREGPTIVGYGKVLRWRAA